MENNDYYEPTIKTARNESYYQVDYANEVTKLNAEKQKLISWLEDMEKEAEEERKVFYGDPHGSYCEGMADAFGEVLDFVNKGGKE